MANHIHLQPGRYVAETQVVVTLRHAGRDVSYRVFEAGDGFDVPHGRNGFGSFATYHPDLGDDRPRFRLVETAK